MTLSCRAAFSWFAVALSTMLSFIGWSLVIHPTIQLFDRDVPGWWLALAVAVAFQGAFVFNLQRLGTTRRRSFRTVALTFVLGAGALSVISNWATLERFIVAETIEGGVRRDFRDRADSALMTGVGLVEDAAAELARASARADDLAARELSDGDTCGTGTPGGAGPIQRS